MTGTTPTGRKEAARRPTDMGKTLARSLIIRALRHADLHHVLRGRPGAVGFVVPDPGERVTFIDAARDLLRSLTSDRFAGGLDLFDDEYAIVDLESDRDKRLKISDAALRNLLMANTRLFVFGAPHPATSRPFSMRRPTGSSCRTGSTDMS